MKAGRQKASDEEKKRKEYPTFYSNVRIVGFKEERNKDRTKIDERREFSLEKRQYNCKKEKKNVQYHHQWVADCRSQTVIRQANAESRDVEIQSDTERFSQWEKGKKDIIQSYLSETAH